MEYLSVRVFDRFSNLLFCGVWADDTVLSGLLVLHLPSEIRFELLVIVDGLFQPSVYTSDLWCISWRAALWIALDLLQPIAQSTIRAHDLAVCPINFCICRSVVEHTAVQTLQALKTVFKLVNGLVYGLARIEDIIWV